LAFFFFVFTPFLSISIKLGNGSVKKKYKNKSKRKNKTFMLWKSKPTVALQNKQTNGEVANRYVVLFGETRLTN
jgi:hypothetical protein